MSHKKAQKAHKGRMKKRSQKNFDQLAVLPLFVFFVPFCG
jgi:hypothetical protein